MAKAASDSHRHTPVFGILLRKELAGYFATPLAAIFILVFLGLAGALTFYVSGFFQQGQADLKAFFSFHPWLYLFLVPALTMRLWAEERKSGTIELLMTLPVRTGQAVLAKFFAAWLFTGFVLLLTLPMVATVNYLGDPDNGVIAAQYAASWLLAGGFIAVGSFCSALSKNQVIAFIASATVCFLFIVGGTPLVLSLVRQILPAQGVEAVAGLSALPHYEVLSKGLLSLKDVVFFMLMIATFLAFSVVTLQARKAD